MKKSENRKAAKSSKAARPATAEPAVRVNAGQEAVGSDGRVVLQIRVRPELKQYLQGLALQESETLQTFVLRLLQGAGLPVTAEDLLDLRKGENRPHRRPAATPATAPAGASPDRRQVAVLKRLLGTDLVSELGLASGQGNALGSGAGVLIFNIQQG
jgi:hypothetical protein